MKKKVFGMFSAYLFELRQALALASVSMPDAWCVFTPGIILEYEKRGRKREKSIDFLDLSPGYGSLFVLELLMSAAAHLLQTDKSRIPVIVIRHIRH